MTVREAHKNGTFAKYKKIILMDFHRRIHIKIQDCWDYEIESIDERPNFGTPVVVLKARLYKGMLGPYDTEDLISLAEWAKINGIDPATARQRALRGAFTTARKIGRNWVIDKNEPLVDHRRNDK